MDQTDILDDEGEDSLDLVVTGEQAGERLDRFLAAQCAELSRTRIKQLALDGQVLLNGKPCDDPSLKIKDGMRFTVIIPPPLDDTPVPENIPLDIIYEDDDLIVLNKQVGLVVHPAPGHYTGTLVNALLYHCGDSLSGIGGVRRPGIVHRLDKDTSGLMMVAKNDAAHKGLSAQLSDRTLSRRYTAVAWGNVMLRKGVIDAPIARHHANRQKMTIPPRGGRDAVTHYERRELLGKGTATIVECHLETGRTHQVRLHMAHLGHPLVGDPVYGLQQNGARAHLRKGGYDEQATNEIMSFTRQALCAQGISFIHPATDEDMDFEIPLPDDMNSLINSFKSIG